MSLAHARAEKPTTEQLDFFEKQIRPLLIERCYECHGDEDAESEFRIDSRAGILRGGIHGPAAVVGAPEKSLMIFAVNHAIQMDMPPKFKLPQREIDDLARWVKMGLPWTDAENGVALSARGSSGEFQLSDEDLAFWSLQPITRPDFPSVTGANWVISPIDYFVLARLESAGLRPAQPASRSTLIRRVTFDLTGLPPTPAEVTQFLHDQRPDAYERLVDRLLASPAYGERWGRHWLDVVRYADSNGLDENLAHANAFRYRDYVVRSLNQDKGYDQFLSEQIAGDLLPDDTPVSTAAERVTATGFLSIGAKMLAEDDPVKMQMDIIDEQVSTLSQAFMGLTMACARCHDHKFDPISTADYYALAGIFKSTTTMDNFKVVAQWHERPVADPVTMRKTEELNTQITERETARDAQREAGAELVIRTAREHTASYLLAVRQLQGLDRLLAASRTFSSAPDTLDDLEVLTLEAEEFQRGNALRVFDGPGEGIGVIQPAKADPSRVEYDIQLSKAGLYQVEIRYAAASAAPLRLSIDSDEHHLPVAGGVTGGLEPGFQFWERAAIFELDEGSHSLVFDGPKGLPALDKIRVIRLAGSVPAVGKDSSVEALEKDAALLLDSVSVQAETFARGNVTRLADGYGKGIGAIAGPGGRNELEYDVSLPRPGTYHLAIRYAAAESRPVKITANGTLVNSAALATVSGSWYPDTQRWELQGTFHASSDRLVLRLERDGPIPHLDQLLLVPAPSLDIAGPPRQPQLLARWRTLLEVAADDPENPLALWHRASRGELPLQKEDGLTAVDRLLLSDGPLESLESVARRYQDLVLEAQRQWEQRPMDANKDAPEKLEDEALESIRRLVYGPGSIVDKLDVEQLDFPEPHAARIAELTKEIAALRGQVPDVAQAMAVADGAAEDLRIHVRGNHLTLGATAPRGFPQVLSMELPPLDTDQSGRLELARWLTSDSHPLTARVMANRIWRWHFGKALVRSPDNFGKLGQEPTHPQLLDFLAHSLREDNWSVKQLHRLILLSATYQMSSTWNSEAAEMDPDNKLLWRMNRRRMEAEVIRDAILAVGGNLDLQLGGSLLPTKNRAYVTSTANIDVKVYDTRRRSIYLPVVRSALYAMFQVFDFAEPSVPNGERQSTTLASQALFMMNSNVVMDQSRAIAERLAAQPSTPHKELVRQLYMRLLGREPDSSEVATCQQYMQQYQQALSESSIAPEEHSLRTWAGLCRAILASNEFIYLD